MLDSCELWGVALTPPERARLDAVGEGELEALRLSLEQTRRSPPYLAPLRA